VNTVRLHVYVSGPFSSAPMGNVLMAEKLATSLMDRGYAVFCPHTSYFWHDQISPRGYEFWMAQCLAWVAKCDILYRMDGASSGADRECALAVELGVPIVRSLSELADIERAS
jgi:hypothetical protein